MIENAYNPLFTILPAGRNERWKAVRDFIAKWYSALKDKDGFSNDELQEYEKTLGFSFPAALREWYLLAGKRKDIWSQQDSLFLPQTIADLRGKAEPYYDKHRSNLVFYGENQGCEFWAIKHDQLGQDDPPVWRIVQDERQVTSSVSEFAIQTLLRETIWAGSYQASGQIDTTLFAEAWPQLSQRFKRCQLSDRFWEGLEPIYFYEGTDAIMVTHADNSWVYFSALNQSACEQLPAIICKHLEWWRSG